MKLRTFNRYDHSWFDISCGTIAISLVTGETPRTTKYRLTTLRRDNGWSETKIRKSSDYTYWYEAVELLGRYTRKTKTVYPRYSPSLRNLSKTFKRGQVYLVCTTGHLSVVKDGLIYDSYDNSCQYPKAVKDHPWAKRKTWCYRRLTNGN